ncbi:MAG: nuclear transport factor 2 family protein [Solirubrobacteraceae bacterium]
MSTSARFDLERFTRAAEEHDAATRLSVYGPDATATIVDKITQPGSPRELRKRKEIKDWLEETHGRDITHRIGHKVKDDRGAAYTQACRYPDGTNVVRNGDRVRRRG